MISLQRMLETKCRLRRAYLIVLAAAVFLSARAEIVDLNKSENLYDEIVVVKVGGSSITNKASKEQLDSEALDWFAKAIFDSVAPFYKYPSVVSNATFNHTNKHKSAFIVVHGAGSFGHFTAKQYGLKGQSTLPTTTTRTKRLANNHSYTMKGLAETRLSVQTLNRLVVERFLQQGLNAVGISPCFSMLLQQQQKTGAATNDDYLYNQLVTTLNAGLIPILHGDACLYETNNKNYVTAGILSGDVLMALLGPRVSRAIFLTDVDGVYDRDPNVYADARLLPVITSNDDSCAVFGLEATKSIHEHDVTGGFKVSCTTLEQESL
jgi:isopentenyl phosphate kinase